MTQGYLEIDTYHSFHLPVSDGHELYVEEAGNPDGQPVIFLHGGPGGSVSEKSRRFFNPEKYRMILFDQRGTGQSKPFLSLESNTVLASVEDIEVIRDKLDIDEWIVFGGSYGSTLALAYAIHRPERVQHLVLRGIFLGRDADIHWLFQFGASEFYPAEFQRFKDFLPAGDRDDIVQSYYRIMTGDDKDLAKQAMKSWNDWESSLIYLVPQSVDYDAEVTTQDQSSGLLEAHYFANKMFWGEDNYLLDRIDAITEIPTDIVHGRYDVDCRPSGAYQLAQALPQSQLHIIEAAGHSPYEEGMMAKLIEIMDRLVADSEVEE